MYADILVPLDGSAIAEAAIGPAIGVAEKTRGRVCLLSIQCRGAEAPYRGTHRSVHPENARRYLEDAVRRFQSITSAPLSLAVRHGDAAEEIVAEAASHDLIVMTSHGRGGTSRAWFGSVTDECVRTCATPVLVVRSPAPEATRLRLDVARVVVPLDGSALAESVLPTASYLSELFQAPLRLVRSVAVPMSSGLGFFPTADWVPTDPQQGVDEARGYLEGVAATRLSGLRIRPTVQVTFGPHAARAICDLAGAQGLVVMATHGAGGMRRALLGSVSDKVMRAAEGPVLFVRPAKVTAPADRPEARSRPGLSGTLGRRVVEA